MLQAVDGVALKWAVDEWASAPADQQAAAFAAAKVARWTEYSFESYSNILLRLTLILYGLAIALGTVYPRWLGWILETGRRSDGGRGGNARSPAHRGGVVVNTWERHPCTRFRERVRAPSR